MGNSEPWFVNSVAVRIFALPYLGFNPLLTMYAIVNIAGQQFKVRENQPVFVHRLDAQEGDSIQFDQVLLVDNNGSIKVGSPMVAGAKVSAKVLNHLKGDKVLIFHKKRRKGYRKLNGHRQYLTKIQIEKISA